MPELLVEFLLQVIGPLVSSHRIGSPMGQAAYLALLPLAVGVVMAAIGGWGRRRRLPSRRVDRFLYGFLFAVAFGIVRHCTAR